MAVYGDDEILYPIDDKNQEVYLPISSLINQNYVDEPDDNEDFLRKHTLNKEDRPSKELRLYCCAVCGSNAIIINSKLERLPTRRTDGR